MSALNEKRGTRNVWGLASASQFGLRRRGLTPSENGEPALNEKRGTINVWGLASASQSGLRRRGLTPSAVNKWQAGNGKDRNG